MATATRHVTVPVPEPVTTFSLELTYDEAVTLTTVLANVGGDPDRSRRQFADAVGYALTDAGVTWLRGAATGTTTFRDNDGL